jgi:hypothetical protein
MVTALPSTGLDGPALTLTSDEVWGDDKILHLSGLPVTDTGEDLLNQLFGTVCIECLSGLYPIPIRSALLKTPLVWCMNGEVTFSVGSAPHSTSSDNKITGWLGVNNPKETMKYCYRTLHQQPRPQSVFDPLHMAMPLPFNHGLPVGYIIIGKATGAQAIEAWNVFAGEGENSHQWLGTPFFTSGQR